MLPESQPFEDAIEDREDADAIGVEVVAGRFGAMADLDGGLGLIGVLHGSGSGRRCGGDAGYGSLAWAAGAAPVREPRLPPSSSPGGVGDQGARYQKNSYVKRFCRKSSPARLTSRRGSGSSGG